MGCRLSCNHFLQQQEQATPQPVAYSSPRCPRRPTLPANEEIRLLLTCPLSGDIMKDPVKLVQSGTTFDRQHLCESLLREPDRCPSTGMQFGEMLEYEKDVVMHHRLSLYMGENAYEPYDDSSFRRQYEEVWRGWKIACRLYGMNRRPIDWVAAQEMAMNGTCRDDSIMSGFTALLLHPDIFPDSRLQKDRREAKRAWLKVDLALSALIEGGNPWAQWINGVFLDIADHDFESAKDMYQLAADQGHALAQYNLGVLYEEEDQIENAEHYYRLAADQGHALAQYNLAMLFELDFETSMPHLEAAAAQGYAAALVYLGNLYLDSDVVEQDIERARHYFELAAKQGNIDGSVALEHITIGARGKDGSGGDQSGTSALSHGDDRDNENKNLYYQAHDEIMMLEKDDDLKVFLLQDLRRKQQTRAMTLLDVWNLYKQARDEIMKLEKDRARRVFLLYFRRKQQKRAVTLLDVWNLYKQARDEIMKLEKGHDLEVFLLQELQRKFRVAYPQFTSSFLDVWNLHKQARDEIRARRVFLLYLLLVYLHRKQQKRAVTLLDALHLYKQARDEIIKLMTRHSDKEKNTVPS